VKKLLLGHTGGPGGLRAGLLNQNQKMDCKKQLEKKTWPEKRPAWDLMPNQTKFLGNRRKSIEYKADEGGGGFSTKRFFCRDLVWGLRGEGGGVVGLFGGGRLGGDFFGIVLGGGVL